ncbi:MAG: type II toxin-antitoxin system RelE/ParE family toxin [Acidobacteriota bacterium]
MADYSIVFALSARRELENLQDSLSSRVLKRIESPASNPRPSRCRELAGAENLWRVRVGDHRVIYAVDDRARMVDIIAIRHRRDAYQRRVWHRSTADAQEPGRR